MMQQKIIDEIKNYLFDHLENSSARISELLLDNKFDVVINDAVENCYDKTVSLGGLPGVSVLGTGLLHYLLTRALITSQRKVTYRYDGNHDNWNVSNNQDDTSIENSNEILLNIVIPDIKTLKKDPKKSLILCIPDTDDPAVITPLTARLEKIQPQLQNIWMVLPSDNISTKYKTYVLDKNNNTFSNIIFDIGQFTSVNQQNQFKILKI